MCISTIARSTYHTRSKLVQSLWLCIALVILGGSSALGQTSVLPVQEVRTIYPNEWNTLNQTSVTYSTNLELFFLLKQGESNDSTSGESTIVALTPYEDLVDSAPLNFEADSVINIAFDDVHNRLFLLDTQQATLSKLSVDADGHLDPATLISFNVLRFGFGHATDMDVDVKNSNLLILESNDQRIVRITLSANFDPANADFSAIDLSHLQLDQMRSLAVNPVDSHIFIVDKRSDSLTLYELTPSGQTVAMYGSCCVELGTAVRYRFNMSFRGAEKPYVQAI